MVNKTQTDFSNSLSTKHLLNKIIDYAGIFPPSELPLNKAIKNYAEYINGGTSWIIGPFVFPAYNLEKVTEYMNLFNSEFPLSISATIRKSTNAAEMLKFLKEDLRIIQGFKEKNGDNVYIDALELPLPNLHLQKNDFEDIIKLVEEYNITCFCELPVENNFCEKELKKSVELISLSNNNVNQLRAKLRTGSVKKELIPNLNVVSSFIYMCKENDVSMKFTAGLHHPIRMYRDEVNTKMHGFINVFTAGFLAFQHNLDKNQIYDILSDENHTNFEFKKNELKWKEMSVSAKDIQILRNKYLCSFGSCNFVGPVKDFIDLEIIEGGI